MFSQGSCEHSHPSFMIHLLSPHVSTSAPTPGGSSMFPQPCDLADPCSTVFQRNLFFQVENHSLLLLTATIMTATNVAPVVPAAPVLLLLHALGSPTLITPHVLLIALPSCLRLGTEDPLWWLLWGSYSWGTHGLLKHRQWQQPKGCSQGSDQPLLSQISRSPFLCPTLMEVRDRH